MRGSSAVRLLLRRLRQDGVRVSCASTSTPSSSAEPHAFRMEKTLDTPKRKMKVEFSVDREKEDGPDAELTKLRVMRRFLLDEAAVDSLKPIKQLRSAYHGEPPSVLYSAADAFALAVVKHGSKRALEKAQARSTLAPLQPDETAALFSHPVRTATLKDGSAAVVLTALAANAIDASCKGAGFWLTGSHSMFAECIHSCADTANQLVVYVGIRNSTQMPDRLHPYGYANVRYVTSLISGVGIFFIGTGLNVYHGIEALWGVGLLGISFITQGTTIARAYSVLRKRAEEQHMTKWEYVSQNEDPSLNVVLFEDTASIVGVIVAGGCIALSHITGSPIPDAVGSIIIGALLGGVASKIISANASHLVGRSIPETQQHLIVRQLEKDPAVNSVHDVKATEMGADQIRFKAEIDFDGRSITRAYLAEVDLATLLARARGMETEEELRTFLEDHGEAVIDKLGAEVDRIEQDLKKSHPDVRHVDLEAL